MHDKCSWIEKPTAANAFVFRFGMSIITESTFVTSNEATIGRFQSSFKSEVSIPIMQSVPN